ncbi:MAG: hypothetical protein ACI8Z7_000724 [Candidatus Nanohaloarchaea archaeon]|jgi:hypothetical protein
MTRVIVYADVHNDENYAKDIFKEVLNQNPDSLFLESDDKNTGSYLFSCLVHFPTLETVFQAFDADASQAGIDEEFGSKALYDLQDDTVKSSMEYIFRYVGDKPTTANMSAIKNPGQTWMSEAKDEAMNSLLHQMSIREGNDRSTLWSRLAVAYRKTEANIHLIDLDRSRIWKYGAKNISQLPDNPKKVKKAYKLTRKGKENPYVAGVKKLLDSSMSLRDEAMAIQVKNTIEAEGYRDSGVVVGREHAEGVAKILSKEFDVQIEE